jgi:hypothetical protein
MLFNISIKFYNLIFIVLISKILLRIETHVRNNNEK